MDALKLPKSGSGANTPTGKSPSSAASSGSSNVSVTVRFNANDECVESIYPSFQNSSTSSGSGGGGANSNSPGSVGSTGNDSTTLVGGGGGGDSLASSPSQHQIIDDQTNRNNFLQGNFFNRKRSGSIEGISPTSSGPNLVAAISSGDSAASVGTWKLFKGKVTQTIEDIKSSKSNIPSAPTITLSKGHFQIELDSDQESASLNPYVSDENSADAESKNHRRKHSKSSLHHQQQHNPNGGKEPESDSDIESENLLEGDTERSRLRRGLANLKSKVKAKAAAHHHHHHHHHHHQHPTVALAAAVSSTAIKTTMPKDSSPQRNLTTGQTSTGASNAATSSLRTTFLRKRRKQTVDAAEVASPSVMPEEAIPVATTVSKIEKKKKGIIAGKKEIEIESGVEMLEDMTPQQDAIKDRNDISRVRLLSQPLLIENESLKSGSDESIEQPINVMRYDNLKLDNEFKSLSSLEAFKASNIMPLTTIACLSALLLMPIHDFIRGVIATFLGAVTLDTVIRFASDYIIKNPSVKKTFKIPDYSKMPILEIPAVEEHTIVKSYSGWMNEVNSYDPNNFHITMSKSVFVKLEGSILRLSTTTARIPKKVLWNEPPIDHTTLTFTDHRVYDLLGCRVELLPLGLARKRYFNRKYPIQLIIRNGQEKNLEESNSKTTFKSSAYGSKNPPSASLTENNEQNTTDPKTSQTGTTTQTTNANVDSPVGDSDMDFATTVLNADLQSLHDSVHSETELKDLNVPRGDEVRLLLFSRADREKEDWFRRFLAASTGEVHEQNLRLPNIKLIHNSDLQARATKSAHILTNVKYKEQQSLSANLTTTEDVKPMASENMATYTPMTTEKETETKTSSTTKLPSPAESLIKVSSYSKTQQLSETSVGLDYEDEGDLVEPVDDENFEGLIMSSCVARNPIDYVKFMATYQKACRQSQIPVFKTTSMKASNKQTRKHRRARRQENELWKGIDQSLFLGPSGSVVWANVLLGRVIYSCLNDSSLKIKLKDLLQRKLSSVKLPSFMENVVITQIHLGDVSPLIHRVSQPMLDERGTWLDADITYEGFCYITVTTKLNLLRLKRQTRPAGQNVDAPNSTNISTNSTGTQPPPINIIPSDLDTVPGVSGNSTTQLGSSFNNENLMEALSGSAIFDSEAESSGGSSTESESPVGLGPSSDGSAPAEGNARRLFKLVDRFTASNLFQYATEISYVQRAMENMNANITLRVDLRGLVARGVINLPPPPSDRVWLAFRGPPRLWITAKPTVGDKSVDWSIVTNVIESKLCEQVNRYLVYPNMVDITIPFLGQPTYKE